MCWDCCWHGPVCPSKSFLCTVLPLEQLSGVGLGAPGLAETSQPQQGGSRWPLALRGADSGHLCWRTLSFHSLWGWRDRGSEGQCHHSCLSAREPTRVICPKLPVWGQYFLRGCCLQVPTAAHPHSVPEQGKPQGRCSCPVQSPGWRQRCKSSTWILPSSGIRIRPSPWGRAGHWLCQEELWNLLLREAFPCPLALLFPITLCPLQHKSCTNPAQPPPAAAAQPQRSCTSHLPVLPGDSFP